MSRTKNPTLQPSKVYARAAKELASLLVDLKIQSHHRPDPRVDLAMSQIDLAQANLIWASVGDDPDELPLFAGKPGDTIDVEFPDPPAPRKCRVCGCTDVDCRRCIEKTGEPCYWVEADLCSACAPPKVERIRAADLEIKELIDDRHQLGPNPAEGFRRSVIPTTFPSQGDRSWVLVATRYVTGGAVEQDLVEIVPRRGRNAWMGPTRGEPGWQAIDGGPHEGIPVAFDGEEWVLCGPKDSLTIAFPPPPWPVSKPAPEVEAIAEPTELLKGMGIDTAAAFDLAKQAERARAVREDLKLDDGPVEDAVEHEYHVSVVLDPDKGDTWSYDMVTAPSLAQATAKARELVDDNPEMEGLAILVEPADEVRDGVRIPMMECVPCGKRWPKADSVGCPVCVHGPVHDVAAKRFDVKFSKHIGKHKYDPSFWIDDIGQVEAVDEAAAVEAARIKFAGGTVGFMGERRPIEWEHVFVAPAKEAKPSTEAAPAAPDPPEHDATLTTFEVVAKPGQKGLGHVQFDARDQAEADAHVVRDFKGMFARPLANPADDLKNQVGSDGRPKTLPRGPGRIETSPDRGQLEPNLRRATSGSVAAERWAALAAAGASDEQIREVLDHCWSGGWGSGGTDHDFKTRGGARPAIWFGAERWADKPTLTGKALIEAVRRLLEIPQAEGAKPPRKSPTRTFRATYHAVANAESVDLGLVRGFSQSDVFSSLPKAFAGQSVEVAGVVVPIDPARIKITPEPIKEKRKGVPA